jgi:lipopolysaccharide export system permease protein
LVALFSAGISLARASASILVVTALIAVGAFFISDKLIPPATKKRNYIEFVVIKKNPAKYYTVKTNKIWYRSKDLIYNIRTFNPEKNLVQGLTLYYLSSDWKLLQLVTAAEAQFEGNNWVLNDGSVTLFTDSSFPMTEHFTKKSITLEEKPTDIQDINNNSDIMTIGELQRYIKKNKEAGLDTRRYEVAYHSKFGFAFVSFVMVFLGIPFSVSKERSGGFALNVTVCLVVVFAYWTLFSLGMSLGNNGHLSPWLAAWLPNALMMGVGTYFLLRLKR